MNVVGKVSSFISQGMYSVATPFHPFGGAVDIIVVKQQDGTFRSTPWYVRFGKFQGVLKGAEKVVRIEVNGVEANFHMLLDNSGEAYFVREVNPDKGHIEGFKNSDSVEGRWVDNSSNCSNIDNYSKENDFYGQKNDEFNNGEGGMRDERATLGMDRLERADSGSERIFYEFQDEQSSIEGSVEFSDYGSSRYDNLDSVERALESQNSNSEVVLVSVDGHILTAPLSSSERNTENVQLSTPQFHLGPGEGAEEYDRDEVTWTSDYLDGLDQNITARNLVGEKDRSLSSEHQLEPCEGDGGYPLQSQETDHQDRELCPDSSTKDASDSLRKDEVFKSCLELSELAMQSATSIEDTMAMASPMENLADTKDLNEKSPCSPLKTCETGEGINGALRSADEDGLSADNARNQSSVPLPVIHIKAATDNNGSDNLPVQFVGDDMEHEKQMDVDQQVERMENGEAASGLDEVQHVEPHSESSNENTKPDLLTRVEISLCGHLLHVGMGSSAAQQAFDANRVSPEEFKLSASSIIKNEKLIVRIKGKYFSWDNASHIVLGMAAFSLDLPVEVEDAILVERETPEAKEDDSVLTPTSSRRWRLWPIPFRRVKTLEHSGSSSSNEDFFVDSESVSQNQPVVTTPKSRVSADSPRKQIIRTNVPTTDQIASLNLKEGQNMVNFVFSTRVLGSQKVEAHIYLWKWNTKIVISDVDGTITKSDVLGQFMPLVGKDWTHSGIARLFSAIKENGYQLLFLSARAIVQAYLTKSFLFNLKQDGKSLPNGPVVISPDGLFPSLYREVIRRAPHEFKIACLEDIKALFPPDYNPFYAGFGNRDTDELSYRKIGIPKGKIFIINPKGEVAINHRIDVKSYTSLHTLVHDMFPPTSLVEQEDYNSWNYWRMPLPDVE